MTSTDEKLDRIVEALQQVHVNLESLRVCLATLMPLCDDHENRLRSIERWHHRLTPVLAAITFMLGVVVSVLMERYL